jgi:hypothetical protein
LWAMLLMSTLMFSLSSSNALEQGFVPWLGFILSWYRIRSAIRCSPKVAAITHSVEAIQLCRKLRVAAETMHRVEALGVSHFGVVRKNGRIRRVVAYNEVRQDGLRPLLLLV